MTATEPTDLLNEKQDDAVDAEIVLLGDRSAIERSAGRSDTQVRRAYRIYLFLPAIFLTVALFGGLRLSANDGSFIFLKPALACLLFAALLMTLFVRAGLIEINGWFSEDLPLIENAANGAVIASLFAASTQVFNSLIPEQGVTYWVVAFCFFWTLWNNLFAEFDTRRLIRSLGALFGLAFVAKYLIIANLATSTERGWIESIIEDPTKTAASWLLDIPAFAAGTGYIQFFALGLFMLGLYILPRVPKEQIRESGLLVNSV